MKLIKRWRYKRLYHKLYMLYANKFQFALDAKSQADEAFFYLTGYDYWEDWGSCGL